MGLLIPALLTQLSSSARKPEYRNIAWFVIFSENGESFPGAGTITKPWS
jgi:hypothetical protein